MLSEIFRLAARLPGYASGKRMDEAEIGDAIASLLDGEQGLAFGEIHGHYAFPDFMVQNLQRFAEQGVTTLYMEHFFTQQQELLDEWQDNDNPEPLLEHMNRQGVYSTKMWHRYWGMMKAAKENGIRMVAIDYSGPELIFGRDEVQVRNGKWLETIAEDRDAKASDEKFIVYGGQAHFRNGLLKSNGVGTQLDIPTIILENAAGRFGAVPGGKKLYQAHLPDADDQDFVYGPLHKSRAPKIEP